MYVADAWLYINGGCRIHITREKGRNGDGPYKDKVSVSCTSFLIGIEEASVCVGGQAAYSYIYSDMIAERWCGGGEEGRGGGARRRK